MSNVSGYTSITPAVPGPPGKDGTNYIPMGFWSATTDYYLSDLGIPFVKRPDGSTLGYSVFSLNVQQATKGSWITSQWRLLESAEFIYMQDAYIEKLQAELITAEKIESLNIKTGNLEVLDGAKLGSLLVAGGEITSSYSKTEPVWNYSTYPPTLIGTYPTSGVLNISIDEVSITKNYLATSNKTIVKGDRVIVEQNTISNKTVSIIDNARILVEHTTIASGAVNKIEITPYGIYKNGTKIL